MELVGVVSFVFVLADVAATSSDNPFTCEAGNFSSGEPAAITCHFGPNIYNDGYHFEIMHYAFDALDSDTGDTVLQCLWIDKAHQCKTKSGFNFDRKVQENVTLTIPQVKLEFAGRYACQLIPPDERTPRLCDLHVDESSLTTGLAKDVCYSQTGTTVAFIFGVLLILCIIVFVYSLCRKHRTKKLKRALCCFKRARSRGKAYTYPEEDEVRKPFIMVPIRPYSDSDLEDDLEKETQNQKFDGDDEDASARSYKIHISPYNPADDKAGADESEEHNKYSRDKFDEGRVPFKITILPYHEEDNRDTTDQIGSPPAVQHMRYPHRDPYHRE